MTHTIKKWRRLLAALGIIAITGGLAMAQPGGGKQGPPPIPSDKQITKMVRELDKELDLSESQAGEVSELYVAHFETVEEKMKSSQRPSRSEMEALDSNLQKEVKAQLNEDQQKLYTAWVKEQEKHRSSQRPQGGQRPPR